MPYPYCLFCVVTCLFSNNLYLRCTLRVGVQKIVPQPYFLAKLLDTFKHFDTV
jgi:hypothetical protein